MDSSNAHQETAARNAIVACVLKIGKDLYFNNRSAALPSNLILTVVKSVFVEGGTNVCLRDYSELDRTSCKDMKFQINVRRVISDINFDPT